MRACAWQRCMSRVGGPRAGVLPLRSVREAALAVPTHATLRLIRPAHWLCLAACPSLPCCAPPRSRHQRTIMASLRDPDVSVRRRSLDLLFTMATPATAVSEGVEIEF